MFILRVINGEGLESNTVIGDEYQIIYRQSNIKEFRRLFKEVLSELEEYAQDVYAVLVFNYGNNHRFLYENQQNYIMTSDGKTFTNVSLK